MTRVTSLLRMRAPLGGQEIELQQLDFPAGGMGAHGSSEALVPERGQRGGIPISLLRTRIREGSRFTVFDIDPLSAQAWGQALLDWARTQPRE